MQEPIISVNNLQKVFKIPIREHGLISTFKTLVHPLYKNVVAVDNISFNINQGEIIGFIGPNGAGKTTTLKMLTGLLHPTAGNISVSGFIPHERTFSYLKSISMLMGNKSQLNPSITVSDSFYITKEIYQISDKDYNERLEELVDLLEIKELLPKLSRNLSLGERAKCEFAAALLYQPKILFLDEPTLGMDVSIQIRLRDFIKNYNKKYGTTIILTSHYMADITTLCSRTILINKGNLIYDGNLEQLSSKLSPFKLIKVTFKEHVVNLLEQINCEASIIAQNGLNYTIRIKKEEISKATVIILNNFTLNDFSIENPPIETVIDQVYQGGLVI